MKMKITRRRFIKESTKIGTASILGSSLLNSLYGDEQKKEIQTGMEPVDIAVVKGHDKMKMTTKAVDLLGGIKKYVPENARVCILPNAQRNNPGTYTNPDIVQAVIKMCLGAGAKEVNCLSWLPRKNWDDSGLAEAVEGSGANLRLVDREEESLFKPIEIPEGKILKEARIMKIFYEHDIFINIPITKDHVGNKFTGTLKNLMGLSSPKTNLTFHTGHFKNDDINHLDQCIADLNTIIKPTLCIVDATEFIITNGPFGPGKLHKPQKVVAGTDRVAIDAYCATLWNLNPNDIIMIKQAHAHHLGEIDSGKKHIKEIEIAS